MPENISNEENILNDELKEYFLEIITKESCDELGRWHVAYLKNTHTTRSITTSVEEVAVFNDVTVINTRILGPYTLGPGSEENLGCNGYTSPTGDGFTRYSRRPIGSKWA